MKNPLVSIIIPVYNGENYVKDAIDSALTQTYKNIEIIVVNDGSTDKTEQILHLYGTKIRYFNKTNGGVSSALNLAIEKSKGLYISWLSHDDLYYPQKIEKQVNVLLGLKNSELDRTIIYSNYTLINQFSKKIVDLKFETQHPLDKMNYPLYPLLKGLINGCTLLIPKACFKVAGGFDVKLKATQDYALWFHLFPNCNIVFMKDQLVMTRIHGEQGTKTIASVNNEGDDLWIKMVKNLTNSQKIKIGGSVIEFYQQTCVIVSGAGYRGAAEYINKIIESSKRRNTPDIKVSVVIPFFNRIDCVHRAINSVLRQTHSNIEIILVDDGSTDAITSIKKLSKNENIRYYRNKNNKGASFSRNFGINKSRGEFVAFLDSDDEYLPNKIEKQLEFMVKKGLVFTHTSYVYRKKNMKDILFKTGRINFKYPSIIAYCGIATPTAMIHRDLLSCKREFFPESFFVGEDICFWISLSREHILYGIDECLSTVISNGSNTTDNEIKQIQGLKNIFSYVVDNFLDCQSALELERLGNTMLASIRKEYLPKSLYYFVHNYVIEKYLEMKLNLIQFILEYKIRFLIKR